MMGVQQVMAPWRISHKHDDHEVETVCCSLSFSFL